MTILDEIIFPACASLQFATELIFLLLFFFLKQGFFRNVGDLNDKTFGHILFPAFPSLAYNSIRLPPDGQNIQVLSGHSSPKCSQE